MKKDVNQGYLASQKCKTRMLQLNVKVHLAIVKTS